MREYHQTHPCRWQTKQQPFSWCSVSVEKPTVRPAAFDNRWHLDLWRWRHPVLVGMHARCYPMVNRMHGKWVGGRGLASVIDCAHVLVWRACLHTRLCATCSRCTEGCSSNQSCTRNLKVPNANRRHALTNQMIDIHITMLTQSQSDDKSSQLLPNIHKHYIIARTSRV